MANSYEAAAIVTGTLALAPFLVAAKRDWDEQFNGLDSSGLETELWYGGSAVLALITLGLYVMGRRARA